MNENTLRKRVTNLSKDVSDRDIEIERLRRELQEKERALDRAKVAAGEQEKRIDQLVRWYDEAVDSAKILGEKLATEMERRAAAEKRAADLEQSLEQARLNLEDGDRELKSFVKQCLEHEKTIEEMKGDMALTGELVALCAGVAELKTMRGLKQEYHCGVPLVWVAVPDLKKLQDDARKILAEFVDGSAAKTSGGDGVAAGSDQG